MNTAVKTAVDLCRTTVRKATIALNLNLAEGIPPVMCGPWYLEQVILNLIINAMQAIDHDHGMIEITSGVDKKTSSIYITVAYNGRGIDPSIACNIFDPFITTRPAFLA